jgi:hypothetical protein
MRLQRAGLMPTDANKAWQGWKITGQNIIKKRKF